MATTLTAMDRCDRCGGQAYVVTFHFPSELYWCAHHYRANEAGLADHVIHDERHKLTKQADPLVGMGTE